MSGASPWSIKGVSREDRELAKQAATKSGEPIGVWLARRIRESAAGPTAGSHSTGSHAAELPGDGGDPSAAPSGMSDPSLNAGSDPNLSAAGIPPSGDRRMVVRGLGRRATDVPGFNFGPGQWRQAREALQAIEQDRVGEGVAALRDRMRRLESRLESPVPAIDDLSTRVTELAARIDEIVTRLDDIDARAADSRLTDRIDRMAVDVERLDDFAHRLPRDSAAALDPIERDMRRIADRLQLVEELVLPKARQGGFFSRLFGRKRKT